MPAPRPGAIKRVAVAAVIATVVAAAAPGAAVPRAAEPDGAVPFESPAGLVVVRARVDGGRALRLLLDTGDPGGLTLYESAARALDLAPGPPRPGWARGLGGGAPVPRRPARLRELVIGASTWRDVAIDVIPGEDRFAAGVGAKLDGCLGTALIADRRVTLDYATRTLWLGPGAAPAPPGGAGASLRLSGGRLLTTIRLGDAPAAALIDTASAVTFVDPAGGAQWTPLPGDVRVVDAGGRVETFATVTIPDLAAGGVPLAGIAAVPADLARRLAGFLAPGTPAPAAILGADLLSRHRVVLDAAAGVFLLDAPRP